MQEINKWRGLVDTSPVCQRANDALRNAILTAQAFAPSVLGVGGKHESNMMFVAKTVRDGMLGMAFATIATAHERLSTQAPRLPLPVPQVRPTPVQEKALCQICLWRVAQIWHGPLSPEALSMYERVHQNLHKLALLNSRATESIVVALCHRMCVRAHVEAGGEAAPFAPTCAQAYLNNSSVLLDDPVAAYCLLESASDAVVYRHFSERLRRSVKFNMHLVMLAGDDVLAHVPSEVYETAKGAHALLLVRRMHYSSNPQRAPWLRILATTPRLVLGRGSLDLVDVDGWRAQG